MIEKRETVKIVDKRKLTNSTVALNVVLKGILIGFATGVTHLLVFNYLKHKFGKS